MIAEIFHVGQHYAASSFKVECISAGISVTNPAISIHMKEKISEDNEVWKKLSIYGFTQLHPLFPNIVNRSLEMERERTISGLIVK